MSKRARLLHDSPWQGVLQVTGGGIQFLAEMLGTAGASRTVLDAGIPYSAASLAESLGSAPPQACSAENRTARWPWPGSSAPGTWELPILVGFALHRQLGDGSNQARHPPERTLPCRTATHSFYNEYDEFSVADDRTAQEQEVAEAAWHPIARGSWLDQDSGDQSAIGRKRRPEWRALVEGRLDLVSTTDHDGALLFPGSFNPLHEGHRRMMEYARSSAASARGFRAIYRKTPDKPLLDYFEIHARLKQFQHPVWLTRAAQVRRESPAFPGGHVHRWHGYAHTHRRPPATTLASTNATGNWPRC